MRGAGILDRAWGMKGAFYVARGEPARIAAAASAVSLRAQAADLPIRIASDGPIPGFDCIPLPPECDAGGRAAKIRILELVPWDQVLYLDADTFVLTDPSVGFRLLADGWDLALSPSDKQEAESLWHVTEGEREITFDQVGYRPLQLQCGVMFIRRSPETVTFMAVWLEEFNRWGGQDQAAFIRALNRVPLRVYLLGRPFNGGAVIAHHFGRARERA